MTWAGAALLLLGLRGPRGGAALCRASRGEEGRRAARVQAADTGLKVVLVGFDGADWRVIRPMMAKGELPAFAGMVRDGASGALATIHDSNSAVIWASIYTGERPERHGMLDFYRIQIPGMASPGLFPVHRTFFKELSDLVSPLGLTRADPGRPLLPRRRAALGGRRPRRALDRRGGRLLLLLSRPCAPSRPESWFLSYGLDEFAARPSGRFELFAQPKPLFRQIRPAARGRRLLLAVRRPAGPARERQAAAALRQLLHPPAGQLPALVLEVVPAARTSSASRSAG